MAGKRDEFPESVQRVVAERAAYICSNPACRSPTVEPHSDPTKSLKTGEVAHIRAASPGGPRYDPEQTQDDRRSIKNAIWLCAKCSTAVDKDGARYPVELLHDWKAKHEDWLKNGGIVPALPEFSIATLAGFTLPDEPATISLKECKDLREHWIRVNNGSDKEILAIDVRIQLPEPIRGCQGRDKPPGTNVQFHPIRPAMMVMGTGTVTRNRAPLPTKNVQLRIDRLPPHHPVEIAFHTSLESIEEHGFSMEAGPFAELANGPYLLDFIEGNFQFEYRGATITKRLFAPIAYDREKRTISVIEVREDKGDYQPVEMTIWS
jgi:hypothetical protein